MSYSRSYGNVILLDRISTSKSDKVLKQKDQNSDTIKNIVPLNSINTTLGQHNSRTTTVAIPRKGRIAGIATTMVTAAAMAAAIRVLAMPQVHAWQAELIAVFMRGLPRL
ncbi:hypothetical protein ACRBEV_32620 (plasmid) [Methylobacterium phyllosphaerae]